MHGAFHGTHQGIYSRIRTVLIKAPSDGGSGVLVPRSMHPSSPVLNVIFTPMHASQFLTRTLFITLTWTITLGHHRESILAGVDMVSSSAVILVPVSWSTEWTEGSHCVHSLTANYIAFIRWRSYFPLTQVMHRDDS